MLMLCPKFDLKRLAHLLVACVLSYAVVVQIFAPHVVAITQSDDGKHIFCLNGTAGTSNESAPISHPATHDINASCCLIIGVSDLPRFVPIITALRLTIRPSLLPVDIFLDRPFRDLAHAPSLPRAPPWTG